MLNIKRDKLMLAIFLMGMSLSLFVVVNGFRLINNWVDKQREQETSARYTTYINVYPLVGANEYEIYSEEEFSQLKKEAQNSIADILGYVSSCDCSSIISGIYRRIGNSTIDTYPIDVVLSYEGFWYRSLGEGKYPSLSEWNDNNVYVVLGTAWKDKTITRQDGTSIIRIENLSCIVTGYFDSFGNDDDESVLVFYSPNSINQNDSIYEYLAENMIPAGTGIPAFSIELLDNKYSVDKVAADMIGNFNKSEAYMGEQSNSIKKDTDIYMFYKFKMIILVLIFLIGLINCIMISQLWFLRQRKDISIMKTMGVSNKMILKWQLLKMLIMMAVSFVIASLADILYLKISGGSFALSVNVYSVLYVIASIVIMLLAMIFPLCILLEKIIPAQEVGRL